MQEGSFDVSSRLAGVDDGKIDVGLGNLIDVVGPCVEGDVRHDLDHLRVVVATPICFFTASSSGRDATGAASIVAGVGMRDIVTSPHGLWLERLTHKLYALP
jgi:hypothetical protein